VVGVQCTEILWITRDVDVDWPEAQNIPVKLSGPGTNTAQSNRDCDCGRLPVEPGRSRYDDAGARVSPVTADLFGRSV
jgi:hypothetical protein